MNRLEASHQHPSMLPSLQSPSMFLGLSRLDSMPGLCRLDNFDPDSKSSNSDPESKPREKKTDSPTDPKFDCRHDYQPDSGTDSRPPEFLLGPKPLRPYSRVLYAPWQTSCSEGPLRSVADLLLRGSSTLHGRPPAPRVLYTA
ncbi:hypothetical protein CRENBAI_024144 [Crenichthys baileyi]|uniref:Uncharacterized protein n=1 Tax=Crenichthys baileyi TaxID=28760 RepID=A0AAV9SMM6_9TELE